MKTFARLLVAAFAAIATPALADINVTPGSGAVIFDFTCFTTKHCPIAVITDGAGTEIAGSAGSPSTKALTIQGIGSGTPIPISGSVTAVGAAASGSTLSGNPVRVGMSDGTNAQNWLAAIALGDGVNGNNTGAVAPWLWNGATYDRARGDLTNGAWVNVKTSVLPTGAATAANQTSVIGTKAGGTAATNSLLGGCVYNASPPSLSDGQQVAEQCDINGNKKVVGTGVAQGSTTGGQTISPVGIAVVASAPAYSNAQTNMPSGTVRGGMWTNLDTWAGTALGTPTNFGTTPGAVVAGSVNASLFIGTVAASSGNGVSGTGVQRVAIASDNTPFPTKIDQTTSSVTNGVMNAGSAYETIAASQTAQAMGATGATGDYLSHCVIYPTTTTPGVVTVFDNTNAAGSNVIAFPGGASSVSNLAPIAIPVGAISTAGAWKVTTGANVVVTCYGKFT